MAQPQNAIELKNVTKTFGEVVANRNVSLNIRRGEVLSLLGENGSGKTTLMNMIAGIYYPDEGEIYVNGQLADIRSPRDALSLGIGISSWWTCLPRWKILLFRWTAQKNSTCAASTTRPGPSAKNTSLRWT